jgi:hypothetical protein
MTKQQMRWTALILVLGLAVTELAVWGRRQNLAASRRAAYLQGINAAAQAVAAGGSAAALTDQISSQLTRLLSLRSCHFQSASPTSASQPGCTPAARSQPQTGMGRRAPRPARRHRAASPKPRRLSRPVPHGSRPALTANPRAAAGRGSPRRPGGALSAAAEPVPEARLGEQVARPCRVGLQLAAQAGEVDPQVAGFGAVLVAPGFPEELLLGD